MKFSFEFLYSFGPTHAKKIETEMILTAFNNIILLVLNNFINRLFTTKSRDDRSNLRGERQMSGGGQMSCSERDAGQGLVASVVQSPAVRRGGGGGVVYSHGSIVDAGVGQSNDHPILAAV